MTRREGAARADEAREDKRKPRARAKEMAS